MSKHGYESNLKDKDRQIELLELSVKALVAKNKQLRHRSITRLGTIRILKKRVADLLNQNHRLEAEGPSRFRRHGQRGEGD